MDQVWSSNIQPLGWVNYNISLTWNKTILGSFPLLTMILGEVAVRSWSNLPRSMIKSYPATGYPSSSSRHRATPSTWNAAVSPLLLETLGWWFHGRISTTNCCRISQPFKLRKPWSIYRSSGWEILQLVVSVFRFPYPICVPSSSLMRKSPFLKMMIF